MTNPYPKGTVDHDEFILGHRSYEKKHRLENVWRLQNLMIWDNLFSETMTPLGLSLETGELVEVASVHRGRACQCVCPSCGGNLVAKQGKAKQWHFAHDSYSEHPPKKECENALWGPIKSYAINYFTSSDITTVVLPRNPSVGTEAKRHSSIRVERTPDADLRIAFPSGHSVLIDFEYPAARGYVALGARANPKDGVIIVQLDTLFLYVSDNFHEDGWLQEALDRLWENLSDSRHAEWTYHPNQSPGYVYGNNIHLSLSYTVRANRRPKTFDLDTCLQFLKEDHTQSYLAIDYHDAHNVLTTFVLKAIEDDVGYSPVIIVEGSKLFCNDGIYDELIKHESQFPKGLKFIKRPDVDISGLEAQYVAHRLIETLKIGQVDQPGQISGNAVTLQHIFRDRVIGLLRDAQLIKTPCRNFR